MKPITPSSSEQRSQTIAREARRPVIQPQPTTKATGPVGSTEKKALLKGTEVRKPQTTTEKRTPQTMQQRQPQGGGGNKGAGMENRNIVPPTPPANRGGPQSTSKRNTDGERKTP
jgi:hypothetical protein